MKNTLKKMDMPLIIVTILISSIGLLMVFSSSSIAAILRYNRGPEYFFVRQSIFFAIAFIAGLIILKIPTKWYNKISWFLIIGIIASLILLLLYGTITNHAQSWFYVPVIGFALQPAEFAKSILILFMATYYGYLIRKKTTKQYLYYIPVCFALILAALIAIQPDLGSALILMGIAFCIFVSIPLIKKSVRNTLMIIVATAIILLVILLYSGSGILTKSSSDILNSEQTSRFIFRNPCQRYKQKTGYQVCNGFIAINNGGLTGVGIGNSSQKYMYLPESHTDFIFAILVEELGLIIGLIVLLLYAYMLYRIYKIAMNAYNIRNSIIAYGTFWFFFLHILINLSGMMALLPLTGVPLPLLSYGGSSTINFLVMIFLTERVAIENNIQKYANS